MNKERLAAFMDAVLAIIMTILILELKKPETATIKALWNLRVDFFAYTLSFFWLGTMWVNLHNEWHKIKYITPSIVWVNVVILFFSSFFPYVTSFVTSYYNSSVAQGFYGIIVLAVTFCNIISGHLIGKANRNDEKSQESLKVEYEVDSLNDLPTLTFKEIKDWGAKGFKNIKALDYLYQYLGSDNKGRHIHG